jgi:hypothetical protein
MATIQVSGPPKESFNKNRPISDLLRSQVKHFQHVEAKLDPSLRTRVSSREALTENAAAQYIAQMTNILRRSTPLTVAPAGPIPVPLPAKAAAKSIRRPKGIPLAAAADPPPDSKPHSAPEKRSSAKKHKSSGHTGKKP